MIKVKVAGARRIWGTLKTCSPGAVSSTLSKLVPTVGALKVKRKTKRLERKTVWWFVVHGSESDLNVLEQSWVKIQSQTLWTLQACYMPADSQPIESINTHDSSSTSTTKPPSMTQMPSTPTHGSSSTSTTKPPSMTQKPSTPASTQSSSFLEPSQSPVRLLSPS